MASKYIKKFPIPEGFDDILRDFAKEVLRNQPDDIVDFGIEYFKCLQEGLVLDYLKKGQNIPCDFRPTVPKITKMQIIENRMNIAQDDEAKHKTTANKSEKDAKIHLKDSGNQTTTSLSKEGATEKSNVVIPKKQADDVKKIITVEKSVTTVVVAEEKQRNEDNEKFRNKMTNDITEQPHQKQLDDINNGDDIVVDSEGNENFAKKVFANFMDDPDV